MAPSSEKDDPWDWTVARVVEELCTDNRSWKLLGNRPMPEEERKKLGDQLARNEVDGVSLLVDFDSPDFFSDLKIRKSKHKGIIRHAINQLRRRSRQYAKHKQEQEDLELSDEQDNDASMPDSRDHGRDLEARKRKLDAERMSQASEAMFTGHQEGSPTRSSHTATVVPGHGSPAVEAAPLLIGEYSTGNTQVARSDRSPSLKKRRVAPTTLAPALDRSAWPMAATEAGAFLDAPIQEAYGDMAVSHFPESSVLLLAPYLGEEALTRFDIADHEPAESTSEDDVTFKVRRYVSAGRRRQVHRFFKRRFVPRQGTSRYRPAKPDTIADASNPDHDDVLPLLGESDSDDEYDSETWAEIEAEKEERMARQDTGLTEAQITETWDEVLANFKASWETQKLPKLEKTAYSQWNKARKDGLKRAIGRVQHDVDDRQRRLADQRSQFIMKGKDWRDTAEMVSTMETVIHTAHDLHTALWRLELLKSPVEPPRPPKAVRQRTQRPRKHIAVLTGDDEILTDDSGLDEFIVNNDEAPAGTTPEIRGADESGVGNKAAANGDAESAAEPQSSDVQMDDRADDNALGGAQEDEVLDLTQVDVPEEPLGLSATPHGQRMIIDLTTPDDKSAKSKQLTSRTSSTPIRIRLTSSPRNTQYHGDLVEREIRRMDTLYRPLLLSVPEWRAASIDVWKDWLLPGLNGTWAGPPFSKDDLQVYMARVVVRLLDLFTTGKTQSLEHYESISPEKRSEIEARRRQFKDFVDFLHEVSRRVAKEAPVEQPSSVLEEIPRATASPSQAKVADMPVKEDDEERSSPADKSPKKGKTVRRDRAAQHLRESDRQRVEAQENRRRLLRAKLAVSGSGGASQKSRLIVNESKEDHQGLIYVPDNIAGRIKDHQIEGVRFMWNQIVTESKTRQGCLLAHTMGLGKTMQIITLLLTIAEAASSEDETISSQIPDDLREHRTLVLSPAGLVNNWMDEFLVWAPEGHGLGSFYKIDAEMTDLSLRHSTVTNWVEGGGVLMVGYDLFKMLMKTESLARRLMQAPNVVIADEAHMMKNPASKVHMATQNFRTNTRIALTGSPLANNVKEYHSMINWVAPHYLSDMNEFRHDYAKPIEDGLGVDSTPAQRRKAITKLCALKQTVLPKVHRATISVLKNDIPPKIEFVVSVPLTPLQERVYKAYILFQQQSAEKDADNTRIFGALGVLNILCNHPAAFRSRLSVEKHQGKKPGGAKDTQPGTALPVQLVSDLLQMMPERGIEDVTLSNKMILFNKILDESNVQGDRVLVFSHSIPTLNFLEKVLRNSHRQFLRLDGETPIGKRQGLVKDFNTSRYNIFLISTTAGSLGLNITGANRVIIFDFKFNPQHEQQAVGRAYRIGQQKPVFVYRFVCAGTFEEKMQNRQVFKMQLSSRVVDHQNPIPKAQRLEELFNVPTEPAQESLEQYKGMDAVLDAVLASPEHAAVVRKLVMSDTFFEESIEDGVLSHEEQLEAQRLISQHNARRGGNESLGQPSAAITDYSTQFPAAPASVGHPGTNIFDFAVPSGLSQASAQQPQAMQAPAMLPAPVQPPPMQPPPLEPRGLQMAQPLAVAGTPRPQAITEQIMNSIPIAPIPGASTQVRHSAYLCDNPQAFKGELVRAFVAKASGSVAASRRAVAVATAAAFEQVQKTRPARAMLDAKWAMLDAANSERFVVAVVNKMITLGELAQMDGPAIQRTRQELHHLPDQEWTNRLSSAAGGNPQNFRNDHGTPATNAAHGIGSGTDHSRNSRLPVWAVEALAKEDRPSPSSVSSSPPRRNARNPFQ